MMHADTVPTGRRKITPAMLAASAARPSCYDPTKPGLVWGTLKRVSELLGIPQRLLALIDYLMGCTRVTDWSHGSGPIWAWPSNAVLCDVLGIKASQLKTLFRMAQELGLFEIHDSPTGKRYGHRDNDGQVTAAYGFDLSPLACRMAEFRQLALERRANWKKGEELRSQVTALRNKVLSLSDLGQEEGAAGDWQGIDARARQLAASRGDSRDPATLGLILAALDELHQGALEALTPVEAKASEPVESDPVGPENRLLLTPTNHLSIAKANTEADEPSRPGALITRKGGVIAIKPGSDRAECVEVGKRERRQETALRGFAVTPAFVVQIAPNFAAWTNKPTPTWVELLEASAMVRAELGVSQHAWGQACEVLGRIEAVVTLAAIDARRSAGEVQSAGGLLRKMVELHRAGTLRLDRTLFGLSDKLKSKLN